MAPQRTSDKTHYGALDFAEESGPAENRSFTLKYLVGLALVAVAVTAAVFAFTSPVSNAAPNAAVDFNSREIADILANGFPGDDRAHGTDCICQDTCVAVDGMTGTCTVADDQCNDAISQAPEQVNGAWKATCLVTSGAYDCWEYPCINEGYCLDQVNGYKCICPFGYEGRNCESDIDECGEPEAGTVDVCASFSTCENTVGAYGCTCNDGFYGDGYAVDQSIVSYGSILEADVTYGWVTRTGSSTAGCEDIDDCASNPCHNGAQCTDLWASQGLSNAFSCDCSSILPGKRFDGEFCEYDVDECTSGLHNCVGDTMATCINSRGSFECSCNDGWEGDGLYNGPNDDETEFGFVSGTTFLGCSDIDDCAQRVEQADGSFAIVNPCLNGGTCSNELPGNGQFVCTCTVGWESEFCGVDINECERKGDTACTIADSHCSNTMGDWECLCDDGFTGDPNDYCFDADDCEFSPCVNGGTCADCGTLCLMCDCVMGFRGPRCAEDWDECALGIHQCHDNGHCINTYGSYECECLPGYSGDGYVAGKCEKVDTCIMWEDKLKTCGAYGAECTENSDCSVGVDCVIIDDSELVDYQTRAYDANGFLDRAASTGEISGATWMDDKQVTDSSGTIVTQCGIYDDSTNSFTAHGECTDVGQSFVCNCDDGWEDSNCDRDIDECAQGTHQCARYATCSNTAGSYTCACNTGHRGDGTTSCHDIDDCTTGTGARCINGKCTDTGKENWNCQCLDGWQDSNCDRDINECLLVTTYCPENSECVNTDGSYECACKPGYTGNGDLCENIDDCASAPCSHGECKDHGITGYGCVCDDGWTDYNCDFDENECVMNTHDCHSSPRDDLEPSRCVNTPGSYYCRCISGFEGDGWTCTDMDDCDPDPCCPQPHVVPGMRTSALGFIVEHSGCIDEGANKYHCNCAEGWTGHDCCAPVPECPDCHNNAQCIDHDPIVGKDPAPGYTCSCNRGFWGDGYVNCNPCSDCAEKEPKGAWILDPNGAACGVGPDGGADTVCMPADECTLGTHNCDTTCATCTDLHPNEGGFSCEAQGEFFSNDGQCSGTTATCQPFDVCGKGEYMALEGDSCNDRVCKRVIPDGKYAIETGAGAVAQCLVLWAEDAKVFPERYNWGGRTVEEGMSASQYADSADACPDPICGVCNYNNRKASLNIELGQVAAWTFARLRNDDYLIMTNVDGNGYRCLGFDKTGTNEIVAPYPQLISFEARTVEAATGVCALIADQVSTADECTGPADCPDNTYYCKKQDVEGGSWSTDLKGPDSVFNTNDELTYFCGFETNQFGSAKEKLLADPQPVWNVHQLGCTQDTEFTTPRWFCEDSAYDMKFVIRSYADKDKIGNPEAPNDSYNAHCLYFPDQNGGQYTNPRRTPTTPTNDGVWIGGMYNGDGNSDHDCGIAAVDGRSQEQELLDNGSAVFHLIAL